MNKQILSNIDGDALYSVSVCGDEGSIKLSDSAILPCEEIKIVCILGDSKHAKDIKDVKACFVKKGYVVLIEPYDVDINEDDIDCVKTVIENSIHIANLIYVVNVDDTDSSIEDYIKLAKTLNKKIEYHLQKEVDLSTYFTINKNRIIDEVNTTYSNLIRTAKAIESIIGKMVEFSEAYVNNESHQYTGKKPAIYAGWNPIIGPVYVILWNGCIFNITAGNDRITGVTRYFVKLYIEYSEYGFCGLRKSSTLIVEIDDHTYKLDKDKVDDSEIESTVCKIFDAVIEEFKAVEEKSNKTTE